MVTNERVQRKMAEVLGWTDLKRSPINNDLWGLPPQSMLPTLDLGKYAGVPNWPTSFDAARELEIEDPVKFAAILGEIVEGHSIYGDINRDMIISMNIVRSTAEQWCEAYLSSEHCLRWVECDSCQTRINKDATARLTPAQRAYDRMVESPSYRSGNWVRTDGN